MIENNCECTECQFRNVAFSTLKSGQVNDLCTFRKEFLYQKGGIIHREGDPINDFKYLRSGLVKVFKSTSNGSEQIIAITKPFDFVSNISIFSEDRYKYSVSALEESEVCNIRLDYIKELVAGNGKFALELMTKLSRISDKIILQSLDIRKRNLIGRVAYILLYFSSDIYSSNVFDLPVSRKEIADYISMSTANVIRTLSDFRKEGIIRLYGKTVEIVDIDKLKLISAKG